MNTNLHRLWAIVDFETADILYATVQYTKCQRQFEFFLRVFEGRNLQIVRYDLARHYLQPTFGSCLKSALVGSLPKV